jgi:Type II restriction endonuclease EcoO109I
MLLNYQKLNDYITNNVVEPFYRDRFKRLDEIKLSAILKRKNPYLFKAKNITNANELVKEIVDAYISSGEETIFGGYLEQLSIYVCEQIYSGKKSTAEGIDMEFVKDGVHYLVSIKSGPSWGNSSQIAKMKDNFRKAKRILGTNAARRNVVAVNGCCYGKTSKPDKGEYLKLCGQAYWEFISDDKDLYQRIVTPLEREAKEKDEQFDDAYERKINQLTKDMLDNFCREDGAIDWERLLKFNSGSAL